MHLTIKTFHRSPNRSDWLNDYSRKTFLTFDFISHEAVGKAAFTNIIRVPMCKAWKCVVDVLEMPNETSWDPPVHVHCAYTYARIYRCQYLHWPWAVLRRVHSAAIGYKLQHFLVTATWIRHVSQREDLPQQNPKGPARSR